MTTYDNDTLKVRLIAESQLETREVVARRAADDLLLVLAADLPDRVESVGTEYDDDAIFAEALVRTRSEQGLELTRHAVAGSELLMVSGDSYFTATHALWAAEFDPPESEHGTLVAVPNRQVVFAHPIRDRSVVAMLTPMLELARRAVERDPGQISPNLYWLREGTLALIDLEETEEQIIIPPASEFAQLLNRL
ncbi:hypothetical protein OJ997_22465 [Solirubrobacter phytolaccae]|uniref:Uncharacterized protein n=1 Tax=Solirubrobacter phytolaccae TaxID=1404360 RepID=A0A9X3NDU1_9ACTN|nr:hypothetical protein [Solirubrobacter phytolaccae]MDA0183090.1 hypothetical protein [Solirubrobacter phytolaccae]